MRPLAEVCLFRASGVSVSRYCAMAGILTTSRVASRVPSLLRMEVEDAGTGRGTPVRKTRLCRIPVGAGGKAVRSIREGRCTRSTRGPTTAPSCRAKGDAASAERSGSAIQRASPESRANGVHADVVAATRLSAVLIRLATAVAPSCFSPLAHYASLGHLAKGL